MKRYMQKKKKRNECVNFLINFVTKNLLSKRKMIECFPERCSHRRCSIKKAVLENFPNFTGKHLCWSLFLMKLQAFRPTTLLKRDSNTGVFP